MKDNQIYHDSRIAEKSEFMSEIRENGNEARREIPVWKRYALTITEAANYYHIGEAKLRILVDNPPNADFAMLTGIRVLIKRKKFEKFLDEATAL